jgi:hypothetical protein
LQFPVACTLGEDCFLQNLVDHDPSPTAQDFTCGRASYDGHNGTDIRVANLAAMRAGVVVRAAADGVVLGVRDGVADVNFREATPGTINKRECGNGVHLQHAEGYRTQYCHLMKGSIHLKTGQTVKAGAPIGMIGLSGKSEFPHVHVGVWKDDVVIDPFTGAAAGHGCTPAVATRKQLWQPSVPLVLTGVMGAGFATTAPDAKAMRDTPTSPSEIAADAPALVYWFDLINLRAGDEIRVRITAPDGSVFAEKSIPITKPMAAHFGFVGKKNSAGKLAVGEYQATLALVRNGTALANQQQVVRVLP